MASLGMSTVYAYLKSRKSNTLHACLNRKDKKMCCEIPSLCICFFVRRYDMKNMICISNTSGEHIGKNIVSPAKCFPTHWMQTKNTIFIANCLWLNTDSNNVHFKLVEKATKLGIATIWYSKLQSYIFTTKNKLTCEYSLKVHCVFFLNCEHWATDHKCHTRLSTMRKKKLMVLC